VVDIPDHRRELQLSEPGRPATGHGRLGSPRAGDRERAADNRADRLLRRARDR
jgi:hypothetical protein